MWGGTSRVAPFPSHPALQQAVQASDWARAWKLAASSSSSSSPPVRLAPSDSAQLARLYWAHARPDQSSPRLLQRANDALDWDGDDALTDVRRVVAGALRLVAARDVSLPVAHKVVELALGACDRWIAVEGRNRETAKARRTLLDLQDRISTYEALYVANGPDNADADDNTLRTPRIRHGRTFSVAPAALPDKRERHDAATKAELEDAAAPEGDGWGELNLTIDEAVDAAADGDHASDEASDSDPELPPPPSLGSFLSTPIALTALSLASVAALPELCLLCSLHPEQLWPHRGRIIETVPLWVDPEAYTDLLPEVDAAASGGQERRGWTEAQPWRTEADWSEQTPFTPETPTAKPRSATDVRAWYLDRIGAQVEAGFVEEALSLIQHGAARNVPGLEETGEDVSLLARLVYDRPDPEDGGRSIAEEQPWSLERWRALTPLQAIDAFTATCSTAALAQTIKSLVMPYLYVLQARSERRRSSTPEAGVETPAKSTATDFLYEFILSLPTRLAAPPSSPSGLQLFLAIVEASIPTLPTAQRLVTSDTDLARLAIAALYGAGRAGATNEAAVVMSRVFECLPAFDSPQSTKDTQEERAKVDLFALGGTASAAPSPSAIFDALASASPSELSAHLDTLDLHLSQLEIFLRYSSPPSSSGLAWFLSSYRDRAAQSQWATRLARTASTGGGGRHGDDGEFESEDEWVGLMEFMADATGVAQPSEGELDRDEAVERGLGRAFHLLTRKEVLRIFFGGLLAAGRFSLARSLFDPTPSSSLALSKAPLEPAEIEELVISASREFYDNAESGNQHSDEMKLALECLSAAPQQTAAIRRERDFIDATSRLCSYRLDSRPGINLAPIEIRHAQDRLTFIDRLLGANPQVAKHPDMVLELARKLCAATWSTTSEVRVLTTLSEAATSSGDWNLAAETCDRIARAVELLRRRSNRPEADEQIQKDTDAAADQAWRACFQLGKHEAWTSDARRKLGVLGQALSLCPPERIQDILPHWNKLELRVAQEALLKEKENGGGAGSGRAKPSTTSSHGAEAAARAAASAAAGVTAAGAARVAGFLAAAAARGSGASQNGSNASSTAATPTSPRSFASAQAPRLAAAIPSAQAGAGASHLAQETAAAASHTFRRAAAFLGGVGGSHPRADSASPHRFNASSPNGSPTTSPRSPAPAAPAIKLDQPPPPRSAGARFAAAFSGLADQQRTSHTEEHGTVSAPRQDCLSPPRQPRAGGTSGFGLRAGLSNTLTAGVGWLIGADEILEEEQRRREAEAERAAQRRPVAGAQTPPPPPAAKVASPPISPRVIRTPSPSSSSSVVGPAQNKASGRLKLGAKPVGKSKLSATKIVPSVMQAPKVVAPRQAAPPPAKEEADDWDAW